MANWLVCLSTWMAAATSSMAGKAIAVLAPTSMFVAIGLEHSVANVRTWPLPCVGHLGDLYGRCSWASDARCLALSITQSVACVPCQQLQCQVAGHVQLHPEHTSHVDAHTNTCMSNHPPSLLVTAKAPHHTCRGAADVLHTRWHLCRQRCHVARLPGQQFAAHNAWQCCRRRRVRGAHVCDRLWQAGQARAALVAQMAPAQSSVCSKLQA